MREEVTDQERSIAALLTGERIPMRTTDYRDESGVLRCRKCGQSVEKSIYNPLTGKTHNVRTSCKCEKIRQQEQEKRAKEEEIDSKRRLCFGAGGEKHYSETWENDSMPNESRKARATFDIMRKMSQHPDDPRFDAFKMVMLYGSTGTGKSYIGAASCNEAIKNGKSARFTTVSDLLAEYRNTRGDLVQFWESLLNNWLIVLDDVFTEDASKSNADFLFQLVEKRVGQRLIVTTNLSPERLKNIPQYQRILSRFKDAFLEVNGEDIRTKDGTSKFADVKEALKEYA